MAFLDFLIDEQSINKQRELSDQAARERFDPSDLTPQLEQAQEIAQEGIADEQIRENLINQIFGRGGTTASDIGRGLGSGRTLSFLEQLNQQRTQQLGDAETELSIKEAEAKRAGREASAQIQTQRRQLGSQREAQLAENRALAEAEADRRRKQLGSTVGKLFGTVAGSFLGPAGAAGGGALGGALFGGGQGAVAGGVSGASTALIRRMGEDEPMEEFDLRDFINDRLTENARRGTIEKPEDEIIPANIDFSIPTGRDVLDRDTRQQLDFIDQLMNF